MIINLSIIVHAFARHILTSNITSNITIIITNIEEDFL